MPIFGLACDLPIATLVAHLEEMMHAMARLGVPFPNPLLSLITLTGAAIPYLRICEEGLVNLKDGKTLGLFVS
jgi:adenine deaminase